MTLDFPSLWQMAASAGAGALGTLGLTALRRKSPLTAEALQILTGLCDKFVLATEQAHGGLAGDAKKQLVVALVDQALHAMGIPIPAPIVDAAIEEAVAIVNRSGAPSGKAAQP